MKCKNCKKCSTVILHGEQFHFCGRTGNGKDGDKERECEYFEVMTNADKIRSMNDEELAEFLIDVANGCTKITLCDEECDECSNDIETCVLLCEHWLEKKVEE